MAETPRAIYFGCMDEGHHCYGDIPSRHHHDELCQMLGVPCVDGELTPKRCGQQQGAAALHHLNGWTALAWWDRTGDSRPGSNSAVIVEGTHDFAAMLEHLAARFPAIYARQTASIYDASHRATR